MYWYCYFDFRFQSCDSSRREMLPLYEMWKTLGTWRHELMLVLTVLTNGQHPVEVEVVEVLSLNLVAATWWRLGGCLVWDFLTSSSTTYHLAVDS